MKTIPEDMLKNFFDDFFYHYQNDKSDVANNKCVNFISNNIDPNKTTATTVEKFLYRLFEDIFNETLNEYEMEYLVIERTEKVGLFSKETLCMPECFVTVLEFCSRDKTYEKLKYALINFMYSILNDDED